MKRVPNLPSFKLIRVVYLRKYQIFLSMGVGNGFLVFVLKPAACLSMLGDTGRNGALSDAFPVEYTYNPRIREIEVGKNEYLRLA